MSQEGNFTVGFEKIAVSDRWIAEKVVRGAASRGIKAQPGSPRYNNFMRRMTTYINNSINDQMPAIEERTRKELRSSLKRYAPKKGVWDPDAIMAYHELYGNRGVKELGRLSGRRPSMPATTTSKTTASASSGALSKNKHSALLYTLGGLGAAGVGVGGYLLKKHYEKKRAIPEFEGSQAANKAEGQSEHKSPFTVKGRDLL